MTFPFKNIHMCICITCTVYRTVISVEHFAIASAGFFVLLASFAALKKRDNFIRLSEKHKITLHQYGCFNTQNYNYPFQNPSLGPFFFRLLSNAFSDFGSVGRKKKKKRRNKVRKGVWS